METRLIIHEREHGPWNMAVDEVLLQSVAVSGVACLRFYQWSPPCLSLGYFQSVQERTTHPASAEALLVRRPTGGGAILHHYELTYSLVVPVRGHPPGQSRLLYRAVHEALVCVLGTCGVCAHIVDENTASESETVPFLCFLRRSPGDVVIAGTKVLGSAQRRWRQALLQHGSLIFRTSPLAPEVCGLEPWWDRVPHDVATWVNLWARQIGERLGCYVRPSELTDEEIRRAEKLVALKYGTAHWNERR